MQKEPFLHSSPESKESSIRPLSIIFTGYQRSNPDTGRFLLTETAVSEDMGLTSSGIQKEYSEFIHRSFPTV